VLHENLQNGARHDGRAIVLAVAHGFATATGHSLP
jgi:hypothetical protein